MSNDKAKSGGDKPHKIDPDRKPSREDINDALDEGLEESFPASDPASVTRSTHPGKPNDKPKKRG